MNRVGGFWSPPWAGTLMWVPTDCTQRAFVVTEPVHADARRWEMSPNPHALAGVDVVLQRITFRWGDHEADVFVADDDARARRAIRDFSTIAPLFELLARVVAENHPPRAA